MVGSGTFAAKGLIKMKKIKKVIIVNAMRAACAEAMARCSKRRSTFMQKYEDGILKLSVPKKAIRENRKRCYIAIELLPVK